MTRWESPAIPTFFPSTVLVLGKGGRLLSHPCVGCPRESALKVKPAFFPQQKVVVVGMAPGKIEEETGVPFTGRAGELLRSSLKRGGLDPSVDVGYANLGRCRPSNDDFESEEWEIAENRCWSYLARDLGTWRGPLVLLGTRPTAKFFQDKDAAVTRYRGLWYTIASGHPVFVARHPASILRGGGDRIREQFRKDIARMARRVLGKEKLVDVQVTVYPTPAHARPFLSALAAGQWPLWFFDIESFDAKKVPSRLDVATDPFHPDFRVRGVAIATSPTRGVWIELMSWENQKDAARTLLSPAFTSPVPKGAFVGGFDESGLIVSGWVENVRNRVRDPWLASIALDAGGMGHSLERLVVEVLDEPQPKEGVDRGQIAEMPLPVVAEYAVRDACLTWRLDEVLQKKLQRGEYL